MKHLSFRVLFIVLLVIMIISCEKQVNDGLNSLINIESEPVGEICSSGGYKIETGLDINENGILDTDEVQDMEYICNGDDGINSIGDFQTDFIADSVYQANSDGFLIVLYYQEGYSGNILRGFIYSDEKENPTTIVGAVGYSPGSTTVLIKKNNYWKVASVNQVDVSISWFPINE